ncbi:MAG: hypothetical protein MHPSP_003100 [Paramarteilia canceri]
MMNLMIMYYIFNQLLKFQLKHKFFIQKTNGQDSIERNTNKKPEDVNNAGSSKSSTPVQKNESSPFTEREAKSLISVKIPLNKLQNRELKEHFFSMGHPSSKEATSRNQVVRACNLIINKI